METLDERIAEFFLRYVDHSNEESVRWGFSSLHKKYTSQDGLSMQLVAEDEILSYVAVRRPATSASVKKALFHFRELVQGEVPSSLIDLGAGPLTVFEAYLATFPSVLERAMFVETQPSFCTFIEKARAEMMTADEKSRYQLMKADMTSTSLWKEGCLYDLATMSYSLGEIREETDRERLLMCLSRFCSSALFIEPGTPRGWATLMRARDKMLEQKGWHVIAPCPHEKTCPFVGTSQWCHEVVRIPRTALIKRAKGGVLGYEDEPFSYLIMSQRADLWKKEPYSRIVHAPQHRSGHSHMKLCTPEGVLSERTVSRKQRSEYNQLKKAEWGDPIFEVRG